MSLVFHLALRELRGGLAGFGIFLACISLGVAAIVGVGSVAHGLADGLSREGRTILGGDASFALIHRELSDAERAVLGGGGDLSSVATLRAMARRPDGTPALVEIKAVDGVYPLQGQTVLRPALAIQEVVAPLGGVFGLAADPLLMLRLNLTVGDRLLIGQLPMEVRAILDSEPDKLAGGIGFGPRVMISQEALRASGLVQPGSLVRWIYRVALTRGGAPVDEAGLKTFTDKVARSFPDAGWEVRTRSNVSPQFSKNLERFTQFLTLVGLTALMVGGVGVANAVRVFVERKRGVIATLKSVGATGGVVFALMLMQVLLVAALGIGLGMAIGAALPFILAALFGALIPFPFTPALYPGEMALGLVYGALTALVFALGPLGHAHDVPVSGLFREGVERDRRWPRKRYIAMISAAGAALISVAAIFATDQRLALIYIATCIAGFVLLRLVALGVMAGAKRLPRARSAEWRLAIANLHRPGALTSSVVLSLGLGLALLVALIVIDINIRDQLTRTLPGTTPSFFFIDIQNSQVKDFSAFLAARAGDAKIDDVPMMRGRITRLRGLAPEDIKAKEHVAWVLEGDRGLTYAERLPEGAALTRGAWWPADYSGPPLVSMDGEVAEGLGLALGDEIAVNVLGRTITAKIANLRKINWRSLGINFVMVFSPNTFAGAPATHLATLAFPGAPDNAREAALLKDVAGAFPAVTSVRVKDALDAVNTAVEQLAVAVRGASGIALIASVLVLAGALAAGQGARLYDAVVLKTLGATRLQLLKALVIEYAILGAVTALFGVLAGVLAAWFVVTRLMSLEFVQAWPAAGGVAGSAVVFTVALGLIGTWRVLGQKPAAYLRAL